MYAGVDRLLSSVVNGELGDLVHEPDSLTERKTVLIEQDPELMGAPLGIGEAVTVSDVIVVQLHVEPRHLSELPGGVHGPG